MSKPRLNALRQMPDAAELRQALHTAMASQTIQRLADREERLSRIQAIYGDNIDDALEALEHLGMAGLHPWQLTFMAQSFMSGDNNQEGPTL